MNDMHLHYSNMHDRIIITMRYHSVIPSNIFSVFILLLVSPMVFFFFFFQEMTGDKKSGYSTFSISLILSAFSLTSMFLPFSSVFSSWFFPCLFFSCLFFSCLDFSCLDFSLSCFWDFDLFWKQHVKEALVKKVWRLAEICLTVEPPHDKTNKMTCVPSEDSDQPGHLHEETLGP